MAEYIGDHRSLIRRILLPSGILFSASSISALLGLVAIAIVARTLSVAEFGTFAVITSVILLVNRLVGFQSWQPVLRLAEMADCADAKKRSILFGLGLKLDLLAALAAGLLSVFATIAVMFHFDGDLERAAFISVYGLVNTTAIVGAPTAILRLHRRHDLFGAHTVATSLLKVLGVLIVYIAGGGLLSCLMVWGVAQLLSNIALVFLGERLARSYGETMLVMGRFAEDLRRFPGLLRAFIETNFVQVAKMFRDGDVLIVSMLLDLEAAAFFRIAKQLGDAAVKVVDPLVLVLFPEFARLSGIGEYLRFQRLLIGSILAVFALGAFAFGGFIFFGELLLSSLFGSEYGGSYVIVGVCVVAGLVRAASQVAPTALLAIGSIRPTLLILVVTGLVYYAGLLFGGLFAQLLGVAIGLLIANLLACGWLTIKALQSTRILGEMQQ